MSRICAVCGKRPQSANRVSNAKNRTGRWLYPNVHKMRFSLKGKTTVQRGPVCTKCVKSGKITKVV
ncbi:50S ribosomal protein L28 [bacterium]|nr:50S ribosomal protein L28 [bacterium]